MCEPEYLDSKPPIRGERGTKWRSFDADIPIVAAELAELAPGFKLAVGEDHALHHHNWELGLHIVVVSEPDGAGTAVGVRITEYLPGHDSRPGLGVLAAWLAMVAARSYQVFGIYGFMWSIGEFIGVLLMTLCWTAMAWCIYQVLRILRRRAELVSRRSSWVAEWHQRFWPALTTRIAERLPYR